MNTSAAVDFERLGKTSKRTAVLSLLGVLLFAFSLWYAYRAVRNARLLAELAEMRVQVAAHELALDRDRPRVGTDHALALRDSTLRLRLSELLRASDSVANARAGPSRVERRLARCAYAISEGAVTVRQRRYREALALYDKALGCDSTNASLLNLKAYAAFAAGDVSMAVATQRRALAVDTTYAWGYMDLARFLCAQGDSQRLEALGAARRGIALRPEVHDIVRGDEEFVRLCGAAFLAELAPARVEPPGRPVIRSPARN